MQPKSIKLMLAAALATLAFLFSIQSVKAVSDEAINAHRGRARTGIGPSTIAVIVNDEDPLSRRIGEYYKGRRKIPAANMIHVRFKPGRPIMSLAEFRRIKAIVDRQTPPSVEAYALTWSAPYRVGCMSITTAFAAGFNTAYCAAGCGPTKYDPYFDSPSRTPYSDFGIRPTMALAGLDFADVKRLIDRGVASDGTYPSGTGYLVSTSDKARNVRADMYPMIIQQLGRYVRLRLIHANYIRNKRHVLFYFTGVSRVKALLTNHFVPGAIADHLTSEGGELTNSGQMSSLAWLRAGATGSYGTVIESCNSTDKFPSPGIVIRDYLHGETLIEAYWKSVAMPGQGIFIGEPLAVPFEIKAIN